MKLPILIISAVLLCGCNQSNNVEKIAADAKSKLQTHLDHDFANKHATVQTVVLVKGAGPKYEGEAEIAADGTSFEIPIVVTSDGVTTLVSPNEQKLLAEFESSLQHRLAVLEGKYSDYVTTPFILDLFSQSLQAAKTDFASRLAVVVPIDSSGDYYFGSGCQAHECTMNEAAWVLDKTKGVGTAIIMKYIPEVSGGLPAHENFYLYGATLNNLPPPLAAWATQNGMTEMNTVPDMPTYQPPSQ